MTNHVLKRLICCLILSCSTTVFAEESLSKALTNTLSVSGQMSSEKFSQLLQQGFKSVVVNRPDSEEGNKVKVSELREIAERQHVSVIYQPVTSGKITQTDIAEFAKYYNELPKPILMVCRSGTRSSTLFNQAKTQGLLHE
ncbi:beta-lactamase hydrolase domain-containing protein [Acinetobacter portensis]|uniref:beta-lactamase hydrolase domain-containing protein n=1 Tax=Acinetobacter portensis TaxID=1839785 RepID=UPI0013D3B69F|nr:sulfur transferase domain-containing protein [Acinetobacter portensis]